MEVGSGRLVSRLRLCPLPPIATPHTSSSCNRDIFRDHRSTVVLSRRPDLARWYSPISTSGMSCIAYVGQASSQNPQKMQREKLMRNHSGIAASVFVLRRLERDAVHRAYGGAEVAAYAAFPAVRITRENDAPAVTRGQVGFLFGILHRHSGDERRAGKRPTWFSADSALQPSFLINLLRPTALAKREHDCTGHQYVGQRQWQHQLPSPGHELIKTRPRQ